MFLQELCPVHQLPFAKECCFSDENQALTFQFGFRSWGVQLDSGLGVSPRDSVPWGLSANYSCYHRFIFWENEC